MGFFEQAWPLTDPDNAVFTQKAAAEKNRQRILGLIARRRCLSQRQLVLTTGHQPSTISNIVKTLKEHGLVREGAAIETDRMGPKETELEVVPDCLWTVGVSLDVLGHRLILINARGHTVGQQNLPHGIPNDQLVAFLVEHIRACAVSAGLALERLGGVCVSVPGVVDNQSGTVLISRSLNLHSFPLGALLGEALTCPVWVERNVACGAYAEYNSGVARQRESFIYFFLRVAVGQRPHVGLSLVIGEKIFQGCNSAAGEVDNNLAFATLYSGATNVGTEAFYDALAHSLIGIVNLLDISCVVLSCNDEHLTLDRFEKLEKTIDSGLIELPERRFELLRSGTGFDGMLLGASLLALHRSFASLLANKAN